MATKQNKLILSLIIIAIVITSGILVFSAAGLFGSNNSDSSQDQQSGTVGEWNGVSHTADIRVRNGNQVHKDDLEKFLYRSMARVELLKNESYSEDITIRTQSRDEFAEQNPFNTDNELYHNWSNLSWFGLLLIPGQSDTTDIQNELISNRIQGYYLISQNEIVVITDNTTESDYITVSERTVIHEATHALQDQLYGLNSEVLHTTETNIRQSQLAIVEGEARLFEDRYMNKCQSDWSCLNNSDYSHEQPNPETQNVGYELILVSPYEAGEKYMRSQYSQNGTSGLDRVYQNPPYVMKEVVFEEKTESQKLIVEDISRSQWNKFGQFGESGRDSFGVVGVSASLYHYQNEYDVSLQNGFTNEIVSQTDSGSAQYSYDTDVADAYEYDSFMPYTTFQGDNVGFVWKVNWSSADAAEMFANAYTDALVNSNGSVVDNQTYTLGADGSIDYHTVVTGPSQYQGVFSIAQNKTDVVITYSSADQESLSNIRPPREEPLSVNENTFEEIDQSRFEETYSQTQVQYSAADSESYNLYNLIVLLIMLFIGGVYVYMTDN